MVADEKTVPIGSESAMLCPMARSRLNFMAWGLTCSLQPFTMTRINAVGLPNAKLAGLLPRSSLFSPLTWTRRRGAVDGYRPHHSGVSISASVAFEQAEFANK